jgi:hypothetical protein
VGDDRSVAPSVVVRHLDPVKDALALADAFGVLSVYLGAQDAATPGNAAVHGLLVELGRLHRSVDASRVSDAEQAHAAVAVAERHVRGAILAGETRDLAIFAALGQGEVQVVRPGSRVPTRATVGPRADVRPLCRALDDARPEGVVLVAADGVSLFEWTPGRLTAVWSEAAPELEGPTLLGPAHAHPRGSPQAGPGFEAGLQRDLYVRRMRDELTRFLIDAGRAVAGLGHGHGWRMLAVAGEERLAAALVRGVPSGTPIEVVRIPHLERARSPGRLAILVAPTISAARARREEALVRQALDGPGERAALGARETLAALTAARVETLLLVPERPLGRAGGAEPEGDDPMLADALVGRALDTGASVVVLSDAAARLLGDDVAALLRY